MFDQFKDGWDTANLFLFDSYNQYEAFSLNCSSANPTFHQYCFPLSVKVGDKVTFGVFGPEPAFWREVQNTIMKSIYSIFKF